MAKPVILTVDDDPEVLRAIERDLRKRYGDRYRILSASSGAAGLDLLKKIEQRNEPVALFLVDHRMPHMNGIEFLAQARKLYPDPKRVLLTAYADTDAAIRAINEVNLHHYLLKPWDPPEEQLYPVLDDLLEDWQAGFRPGFQGLRVLGTRWSPKSYEMREFLARNHVPYQWIDLEAVHLETDIRRIIEKISEQQTQLPLVVFEDGTRMENPSASQVGDRVGLHTKPEGSFFDLAIIGGGPAGLAAAVYGASEGLKTVIVEKEAPGGQAGLSSRIENYLGFPSGLSGSDLARRAVTQARRFGTEIVSPQEAKGMRLDGPYRSIQLDGDSVISAHAVVIATGVQWRKLGIPGMDHLTGAGVYYGAGSTEAISCVGEQIHIIGGANSAGQAAMNFSRFAKEVVMLVRAASLSASMSQYLINEIAQTPNIRVECNTQVVEVHGEQRLEAISIECGPSNTVDRVPATGLFIFIGAEPRTAWLEGLVERDSRGFVLTGQDLMRDGKRPKGWTPDRDPGLLETNIPGVYAVGDVRHGSVKRVASGVGEGSIAIQFVHQYLANV